MNSPVEFFARKCRKAAAPRRYRLFLCTRCVRSRVNTRISLDKWLAMCHVQLAKARHHVEAIGATSRQFFGLKSQPISRHGRLNNAPRNERIVCDGIKSARTRREDGAVVKLRGSPLVARCKVAGALVPFLDRRSPFFNTIFTRPSASAKQRK